MTSFSSLRLPLELRHRIYGYVLGPERLVHVDDIDSELHHWTRSMIHRNQADKQQDSNWATDDEHEPNSHDDNDDAHDSIPTSTHNRKTAILTVSKTTSTEALDILYGRSIFIVETDSERYSSLLLYTPPNLLRIRHLHIVARPVSAVLGQPLTLLTQLWIPLLSQLHEFCLIAEQPLIGGQYDGLTRKQITQRYINWLGLLLEVFRTHLSQTTRIRLDANGHAETTVLMDKYFGSRFVLCETETGDACFNRGEYSLDDDYWHND